MQQMADWACAANDATQAQGLLAPASEPTMPDTSVPCACEHRPAANASSDTGVTTWQTRAILVHGNAIHPVAFADLGSGDPL